MDMNPKIAERDSIYEKAAPSLFGEKFCKEAKEHEEQLCCLDEASRSGSQNFRQASRQRKGAQYNNFKGGTSDRYTTYKNGGSYQNLYPIIFSQNYCSDWNSVGKLKSLGGKTI